MSTHLEQELSQLTSKIFKMADMAIESISMAVDSLKNSDIESAKKVVDGDSEMDRLEVEIDDDCIKILVTRQPAAVHLRLVLAFLKINTDLERIGDLCTAIAKETLRLDGKPAMKPLVDIPRMAGISIEMLKKCFQSFSEKNTVLAREVIEMDNKVDELNIQVFRELFTYMAENPSLISEALGLIMVSKALERIGDHATNIAERSVYYIEGINISHDL